MRIVAGIARGRKLDAPKGLAVRPTSDRVREALFSSIGMRIREAVVLDLFAGSGALGLESLSRGAKHATFVERSRPTMRILADNVRCLGFADQARLLEKEALAALRQLETERASFDLVFLDPPYRGPLLQEALGLLEKGSLIEAEGLVVAEHAADTPFVCGGRFRVVSEKRYGRTVVSFVQHSPA